MEHRLTCSEMGEHLLKQNALVLILAYIPYIASVRHASTWTVYQCNFATSPKLQADYTAVAKTPFGTGYLCQSF